MLKQSRFIVSLSFIMGKELTPWFRGFFMKIANTISGFPVGLDWLGITALRKKAGGMMYSIIVSGLSKTARAGIGDARLVTVFFPLIPPAARQISSKQTMNPIPFQQTM